MKSIAMKCKFTCSYPARTKKHSFIANLHFPTGPSGVPKIYSKNRDNSGGHNRCGTYLVFVLGCTFMSRSPCAKQCYGLYYVVIRGPPV